MTTPLRRQYLDIKRRYPHAILFFRLGDFYETFDGDAEVVARELEITLTSRPVSKGERVPLAGIPYHALDSYLGKLIARGYKVAICEQTEAPAKGKKIVDRAVVRVVTPGTVVEDNLLETSANNYLAALLAGDGSCGVAYVDVSTGEFGCLQGTADEMARELERLRPAELLLGPGGQPPPGVAATLTPLPEPAGGLAGLGGVVARHFGASSVDELGLAGQALAAGAAGLVIEYLKENQKAVLGHLRSVTPGHAGEFMALDANTLRNLELFDTIRRGEPGGVKASGTVLAVIDHTKTPMGTRLLRRRLGQPLLDPEAINERLDAVGMLCESAVRRGRLREVLGAVPDLERACTRVSAAASTSPGLQTPRDLLALRRGLEAAPELKTILADAGPAADRLLAGLRDRPETVALIAAAIADEPADGRTVRPGFSPELDALRSTARDARQYLADLEARERARTGIKSLKVGYNRVFGYYIEVSKANRDSVPEDYLRKQTLVGGERFTLPELQEHEYRVLHAQELEAELDAQLLRSVCVQVAAESVAILETAGAIAGIDVACSLAEAASRYGYVRPVVDSGEEIAVRDGRHPVVERVLADGAFVPNDIELSCGEAQVIVLTGPNMAGKSTYLRQTALIVLLAQIGSFVPAREARIGVVDRIGSRVGALDDISAGHSTFMVEMLETAAMLDSATGRSLLIFDEIGRGTSTYDGMAIARSVAEYIHNRPGVRTRTLFATHYHELTELSRLLPRVRNLNVAVAEERGEVVFLHRILPGGADKSYGVHVARLAGLPRPVVQRAEELLTQLEAGRPAPASAQSESAAQMALFGQADDRLRKELAELEPDSLTPLQAIARLYELQERARAAGNDLV